jgi:hypothetical protein
VVGVAAASFAGVNGPLPGTRLWIPLSTATEASAQRSAIPRAIAAGWWCSGDLRHQSQRRPPPRS